MQEFEKYPELTEHIQRMANTGYSGTIPEWSDFLWKLNTVLLSLTSGSNANKEHAQLLSRELSWETDVVQADLEDKLSGALSIMRGLLDGILNGEGDQNFISAGVECLEQLKDYIKPQPARSIDDLPF